MHPPAAPPRSLEVHAALDVALDLPLASPASRSLAAFVDLLLLLLLVLLVVLGLSLGTTVLGPESPFEGETLLAFGVVAWFVVEWLWMVAWELGTGGRSPGKMALGLRVVDADGGRVRPLAVLVRNLLRPVDLLPGTGMLGLLVAGASARSQRVGDHAAGTVVIQEPPPLPSPARWPPAFPAAGVALVERWFAEEARLEPEARAALAGRLWAWLAAGWPAFCAPAAPRADAGDPAGALREAFGL